MFLLIKYLILKYFVFVHTHTHTHIYILNTYTSVLYKNLLDCKSEFKFIIYFFDICFFIYLLT